jgi:hypothetical protein
MKGMNSEDHLEVSGQDFSRAENEAVKTTFDLRSGFSLYENPDRREEFQ